MFAQLLLLINSIDARFTGFKNFLIDSPLVLFDKLVTLFLAYYDSVKQSVDCCFQNPGFSGNVGNATGALQQYFDIAIQYSPIFYYLVDKTGLVQVMGCIAAAILFRLTMKAITLGRW